MILCEIYWEKVHQLPTHPKSTSTEVSQGVCFPRYDVIKLPGCFVLSKVFQRWSYSTSLVSLEDTQCETSNKIMI